MKYIKFCFFIFLSLSLSIQSVFAGQLPKEAREEILRILHEVSYLEYRMALLEIRSREKDFHLNKSDKIALALSLNQLAFYKERTGGFEADIEDLLMSYYNQRNLKQHLKKLKNKKIELEKFITDDNRLLDFAIENQDRQWANVPLQTDWFGNVIEDSWGQPDKKETIKLRLIERENDLKVVNDQLIAIASPIDFSLLIEAKKLSKESTKIKRNENRHILGEEEEKKQVESSFEEKFRVVTSDLHKTSQENLIRLARHMNGIQFDEYLKKANEILLSFDKTMIVSHETPGAAAVSVLRSGELLSTDELIRRKFKSIKDKNNGMTFSYIDGLIGEQDTVFFSIRPRDPKKSRLFDDTKGCKTEVTFILDKAQALQKKGSYFTPFAFGMGLNRPDLREEAQEYLQINAPLYRSFLFQGLDAYKKLLVFSIADTLRFEALDQSIQQQKINDALKSIEELPHFARNAFLDIRNLHLNWSELFDILEAFDYETKYLNSIKSPGIYAMKSYFEGRLKPINSTTKYLGAFQGFPVDKGIAPPIFAMGHDFWELKIPERVSLDLVSEIRIQAGIKEETEIKQAIHEYAKKAGRSLEEKIEGSEIAYYLTGSSNF